jgi:hypothetical protein
MVVMAQLVGLVVLLVVLLLVVLLLVVLLLVVLLLVVLLLVVRFPVWWKQYYMKFELVLVLAIF